MKGRFLGLIVGMAVCVSFLGMAPASAQQPEARAVNIRGIKGGKVPTPQYQLLKGQTMARTRDWFQILTQYDTAPDWMEELTFTYFALVRDKQSAQRTPVLFRGEVTYVTIQKGRHMSDMYLHPSTIARYGEVERMAVEVRFKGQLVGIESQPPAQQRWWEQLVPVEGFILNRMETPFAMIDFDAYEAIKPRGAGGR